MIIKYRGHQYILPHMDGPGQTEIQFVQRAPHHEPRSGILCQDLLRVLIDRVELLNRERSWKGNADIIQHLRHAIALFEVRAHLRDVEKGTVRPEHIVTGPDGHYLLTER